MYILVLIAIILLLANLTKTKYDSDYWKRKRNTYNSTYDKYEPFDLEEIKRIIDDEPTSNTSISNSEYTGKYQKKLLLTKNEWYEYRKLRELAAKKGYQICPKVRLLDLIEPRRGDPKYKTLFYKIQAKHVDFVICDQNLYVKAILELDDSSHNQADRKERDEFVDLILKDVGYTVIRTRSITDTTLDILNTETEKAPT